jgi:hypothetical protein
VTTSEELTPASQQTYEVEWWNPTTFLQAAELAERLAKSQLVPQDFRNKPEDILVAWSLGAPLGLSLLASLRNICVINGIPSIWGDAALAVCRAHPDFKWIQEEVIGEGDERHGVCQVKRSGSPVCERTFSVADAKRAGLWGDSRKGPWKQYPKRMLQLRARGFALRDSFPDALAGMPITEEIRDITEAVEVAEIPLDVPGASRTEQLVRKLEGGDDPVVVTDTEDQPDVTVPTDAEMPQDKVIVDGAKPPDDTACLWRKGEQLYEFSKGSWVPVE